MSIDHRRAAKAIIELSEALTTEFGTSGFHWRGVVAVCLAALEENMVIDTAQADLIEDTIDDLKK